MRRNVDVLVVGGGPAGLAVAERATRRGTVLVVHRDVEIGLPVRTSGGSWKRRLQELALPSSLYQEIDQLDFAAPGHITTIHFGDDCPVVLDVTATYRHLAALAQNAGAQIECAASFKRIEAMDTEFVHCIVAHDGAEQIVTARFVVDASGHQRAVLASLNRASRPRRFGVGVEAEFRNAGTNARRAVLFVGSEFTPSGYGWIFPTASGTVRVGVGVIRPDTNSSPADLLDAFLKSEKARELGLIRGELVEKHFGVIPADGAAPALIHGRIVSVGDSAGQALPLVGEGIRYSIEAGRKAGDAIASALRKGTGTATDVFAYERWWKRSYQHRFDFAQKANRRMSRFDDARWKDGAKLLSTLRGDEVASLLRMEFGKSLAIKLAWNGGWRTFASTIRSAPCRSAMTPSS